MKARRSAVLVALLTVILLAAGCQSASTPPAATPEPPDRVLFIGNSLTYWNMGIPLHFKQLAESANPSLTLETLGVTESGFSLEQHWELGRALKAIQEGGWDVVVLQGVPQSEAQTFYEYVRKFDEESKNIGARSVLFMPYEIPGYSPVLEEIVRVQTAIGSEAGIQVAPVGLAWRQATAERPDLNLFDTDNIHPNRHGTYLAACVLYAAIFEQSPEGNSYLPIYDFQGNARPDWMSEEDGAFLQRVAWESVVDYQARP